MCRPAPDTTSSQWSLSKDFALVFVQSLSSFGIFQQAWASFADSLINNTMCHSGGI